MDAKLALKIERLNQGNERRPIKTWSRRSMITPDFIGHTFMVHDGRKHVTVFITENMVGHKLGEFSWTTKFRVHGGKMQEAQAAAAAAGPSPLAAPTKPAASK